MKPNSERVDIYIRSAPESAQSRLKQIRTTIQKLVPEAVEGFAYGMPAYHFHDKPLVYYAYFTSHIGLYATPVTHTKFEMRLDAYKRGKGSVQFPNDKPFPLDLISEMIAFKKASME